MYDKNKNVILFPGGVRPLDITISSIEKERELDRVENSDVLLDLGPVYSEREIKLDIFMEPYDTKDYRLLRDVLYDILDKVKFVSEDYQFGKIYSINIDSRYIPERLNRNVAIAEIECSNRLLPYAESIGTTSDIQKNGLNADDGLWSFGMGLESVDDALKYTHQLPRFSRMDFKIFNAGNIPIHPFQQQLKIKITNVKGSTDYLELVNKTNGSIFRVTEKVTNGQTVLIDGPNITINSLQSFRKTIRKYIELDPGWNDFEIKGATSAQVEFDFRFYYS